MNTHQSKVRNISSQKAIEIVIYYIKPTTFAACQEKE